MAKKKMIDQTKYSFKKKSSGLTIDMDIDLERFEGQYEKAQFALDSMIMIGMIPFMPMATGTFINLTKAMSASVVGTGIVYAAAPPMGRFLYEGKNMVGERSGSSYAMLGERKVLVSQYEGKTSAKENLSYTQTFHPSVQSHWFDAAKAKYGRNWVETAKKVAGGGASG